VTGDLLDGTDLAAVQPPDGMVGFGHAEVACLLTRHPGPPADRSAATLGVDLEAVSDDVHRAGLSSLLARGLVQQEDGRFLPRSAAALLDYAMGAATRWTSIDIRHQQGPDLAVVLHAPEVLALLQPRALGAWFAAFTGAVDQPALAVLALMGAVREEHPEARFGIRSGTTELPHHAVDACLDARTGRYEVVDRTTGREGSDRKLMDEPALLAVLSALLR
jgi:hypothetical protein